MVRVRGTGRLLLAAIAWAPVPRTAAAQASAQVLPPAGLDRYLPVPDENPLTAAGVHLGRRLFFDSLLSRDHSLACATCHDPRRAFTDGRSVARGVFGRASARSAPTLVNRAYGQSFFWDGRATSLEEQVLMPIQDSLEMGASLPAVLRRLAGDPQYPRLFTAAFAGGITADNLARALASFVRTILAGDAPIDRYDSGDSTALTDLQRAGLRLFRGKANCTACHSGPNFTDERFHNTGVAWRHGTLSDSGRFRVTRREDDLGAFKTPTLREVARTAPYMHDGSLATLEEVVEFYDRGGRPNPHLDREVRPLHLTPDEQRALVALLRALSGPVQEGVPLLH